MKCFRHSSEDAIGVCRACGQAVCRDCSVIASSLSGLFCSVIVKRDTLYCSPACAVRHIFRVGWVSSVGGIITSVSLFLMMRAADNGSREWNEFLCGTLGEGLAVTLFYGGFGAFFLGLGLLGRGLREYRQLVRRSKMATS